jgi:enoyl-CoA hydratase/carnithine racemase
MNNRSYASSHALRIEVKDHIGYLWLTKNEQNTLEAEYLREIIAAHDELEQNPEIWGVIWGSESPTCFSTGFDPAYMLGLSREQKLDAFHLLFQTTRRIYAFSKPELVLLPGHSFAAGSVLAAAADWRFMANDKVRMSFPEVMLGLSIPMAMLAMLRTHTGDKNLATLVQTGDSFKPEECLQLGIVNEIMPRAELLPAAEKFMRRLFQKPLSGFRAMKKNLRRPVLELFANDPSLDDFESLMGANFEEALRAGAEGRRPKFQNP